MWQSHRALKARININEEQQTIKISSLKEEWEAWRRMVTCNGTTLTTVVKDLSLLKETDLKKTNELSSLKFQIIRKTNELLPLSQRVSVSENNEKKQTSEIASLRQEVKTLHEQQSALILRLEKMETIAADTSLKNVAPVKAESLSSLKREPVCTYIVPR